MANDTHWKTVGGIDTGPIEPLPPVLTREWWEFTRIERLRLRLGGRLSRWADRLSDWSRAMERLADWISGDLEAQRKSIFDAYFEVTPLGDKK